MAMVLEPNVQVASGAEIDAAIARELAELGVTFEELEAQAKHDEFTSDAHERLWLMIVPLAS